jgi:hypothetical protein
MKDITNSDSTSKVLLRMEKRNGECCLINLYGRHSKFSVFHCFYFFSQRVAVIHIRAKITTILFFHVRSYFSS